MKTLKKLLCLVLTLSTLFCCFTNLFVKAADIDVSGYTYVVDNMTFYKGDKQVNSLAGASEVAVDVTRRVPGGESDRLIISTHTDDGEFLGMYSVVHQVDFGRTSTVRVFMNVPDGKAVGEVKAYVWKSFSDMTPLSNSLSSKNNMTIDPRLEYEKELQTEFTDVSVNDSFADAASFMAYLGIMNGYEDGTFRPTSNLRVADAARLITYMTKGEVSASILENEDLVSDEIPSSIEKGYINYCVDSGYLVPDANGYVNYNENITTGEFLKLTINALGYADLAKGAGGWPRGYISVATQYGIADVANLNFSENITRGTAAEILYSAIEVPIVSIVGMSYTDNGTLVPKIQMQDGEQSIYYQSILTQNFGIYKVEGYVIATSKDNIGLKSDEVKFGIASSKRYNVEDLNFYNSIFDYETIVNSYDRMLHKVYTGETDAANHKGVYATAYLKLDENGDWSIVQFTPSNKNVSVTFDRTALDTSDYEDAYGNLMQAHWTAINSSSAPYLKFFKDGSNVSTKYPLPYNYNSYNSSNVSVYVNGVRVTTGDPIWDYVINGNTDKITLVDTYKTDGKYDTIYVNNYVTAMVDAVSSTGKITFSSDTVGASSLILDDEDETVEYHIYLDGEEITPAELQKNDILTIAYDVNAGTNSKISLMNSKFYEIYVSRDIITGTLSAKYDESYTAKIDNTTYSFINSAMYVSFDSVSKLGDNYKLYLDSFGKIYKYEISASAANWAIAEKFTRSSSDDDYKLTMVTADGTTKSYYFDASKATVIRPDGMRIDKNTEGSESALNQAIVNLIYSSGYSKNPIDTRVIQYKVSSSSGMITELKFIAPSANTIANVTMKEEYKASTNTIGSIKLGDSTKIIDATKYFSDGELLASTVSNLVDEVAYKAYGYGIKVDGVYPFVLITEGEAGYNRKTRFAVVTEEGYVEETDTETGDVIYSIKAMYGDATELIVSDDVSTSALSSLTAGSLIFFNTNKKGYITDFDVIFSLGSSIPSQGILAENSLVANNTTYSNLNGITIPTTFSPDFSFDFTTNWTDTNSDAIKLVYGPIIERTNYDISFGKIDANNQTNTLGNKYDANGVVMFDFAEDVNVYTYNYYMSKGYRFGYSSNDVSAICETNIIAANLEPDGTTIDWNRTVDGVKINHEDASFAFAVVVNDEIVDIFNLKREYGSTGTTVPVEPSVGDTVSFDLSSLDRDNYKDATGNLNQSYWTPIQTSWTPYLRFFKGDSIYSTKYILANNSDMSVYVNGVKVTTGDPIWDYVINGDVGEVKLVCTGNAGGRFDEIYVNSYASGMVYGINTAGKILLENSDYGIASLTLDDTVDYNIYLNGEEIAISDLQANDVISVTYDVTAGTTPKLAFAASKFYEVYVSRNVITDTLNGKNSNEYEVKFGNNWYKFSSLSKYNTFIVSSCIGDKYVVYFDCFGRIYNVQIDSSATNWGIAEKFTLSSSDDDYKLTIFTADGETKAYYFDASKASVTKADGTVIDKMTEWSESGLETAVKDLIYITSPSRKSIENRVIQYKVSSSTGMITELKFIPASNDTLGGVNGKEEFSARRYTIGAIRLDTPTKIIDATEYAANEELYTTTVTELTDEAAYKAYAYGEKINNIHPFVLITEGESRYNRNTRFAVVTKEGYSEKTDENGNIVYSISAMYGDQTELIASDDVSTTSLACLKKGDVIYFETDRSGYLSGFDILFSTGSSIPAKPTLAANSLVNENQTYSNLSDISIMETFYGTFSPDFTTEWTAPTSNSIQLIYGPVIENTDNYITFASIDSNGKTDTSDFLQAVEFEYADNVNVYTYDYSLSKNSKFKYSNNVSTIPSSSVSMESDNATIDWNKTIDGTLVNHENITLAFAVVSRGEIVDIMCFKDSYTQSPIYEHEPSDGDVSVTFEYLDMDTEIFEDSYGNLSQTEWNNIVNSDTPYLKFVDGTNPDISTKYLLDIENMSVYVNNVKTYNYAAYDIWTYVINGDTDKITLVDSGKTDGKIDAIYVNSYISGMVAGVSSSGKITLDSADYGISSVILDEQDFTKEFHIYYNGKEITIGDLQENDVLTIEYDVTASYQKKMAFTYSRFYDVYVSRDVVNGTLTGKNYDKQEAKLDDTYYPFISSARYNTFDSYTKLGDNFTFHLDAFGRVFKAQINGSSSNWGIAEKFTLSSSDDDYKLTVFTADGQTKAYYFDAGKASVIIGWTTYNKTIAGSEDELNTIVKNAVYANGNTRNAIQNRVIQYKVSSSTGMITELKFVDCSADTLGGIGGREEFNARNNTIGSIRLGDSTKIIDATKYAMDNELAVTSPSNLVDEVAYKAYAYGTKIDGIYPFVLITEGEAAYNKRTRFAVMTESGYNEELDSETGNIIYTISAMYGDATELIVTDDVSPATLNSLNAGDVFYFKTNSNGHITDIDVLLSFDGSVPSQHILANNSLVAINTDYNNIINPYIQSAFSYDFSSDFTTAWTGGTSDSIRLVYGPIIDGDDTSVTFGAIDSTGKTNTLNSLEAVRFDFSDNVNVYTYDYSMGKDYRFDYSPNPSAIVPTNIIDANMEPDGVTIDWNKLVDGYLVNQECVSFAFAVVVEGEVVDILAFLSK